MKPPRRGQNMAETISEASDAALRMGAGAAYRCSAT
jgi:hypothetical protein